MFGTNTMSNMMCVQHLTFQDQEIDKINKEENTVTQRTQKRNQ